jgi:hypothetical protein
MLDSAGPKAKCGERERGSERVSALRSRDDGTRTFFPFPFGLLSRRPSEFLAGAGAGVGAGLGQ